MLCEVCGKAPATFFFRQTKNGHTVEKNLCSECAGKQGLVPDGFFPLGTDGTDDFFGNFLGSFLNEKPKVVANETCPKCGMTLSELLHNGKVGCDNCYTVFRSALMPTIAKIHGNVRHCGSRPPENEEAKKGEERENMSVGTKKTEPTKEEELALLRDKLKLAIEKQEYEDAAVYRDKIRALEAEIHPEGGDEQ